MIEACSYCGCLLEYQVQTINESLATPEQKRAIVDEARAAGNLDLVRERLATFDRRIAFGLSYRCPGCGRRGGYSRAAYSQEEAEALAAAQNQRVETDAATAAVSNWREEVNHRAVREARYFSKLFLEHFPEWEETLEFVTPSEVMTNQHDSYLERDCALLIRIPAENPEVGLPLEILVLCSEVHLRWGKFWHTHLERLEGVAGENCEHLHQAADLLMNIIREQVIFGVRYRDGRPVMGSCFPVKAELPLLLQRGSDGSDRLVIHSWRGTYDRVL